MREDVGSGKSMQRRECETNKRRFWLGMILWEQTGGCLTYSVILFETRQRFTSVHVHDRFCASLPEEWEMVAKALLSCGEAQFCGKVAAEHKWGRSAEHNFRGINTCAGACVSPHIQPVPPNPKIHQQPTQYP
jgi:hypothetical protein